MGPIISASDPVLIGVSRKTTHLADLSATDRFPLKSSLLRLKDWEAFLIVHDTGLISSLLKILSHNFTNLSSRDYRGNDNLQN